MQYLIFLSKIKLPTISQAIELVHSDSFDIKSTMHCAPYGIADHTF